MLTGTFSDYIFKQQLKIMLIILAIFLITVNHETIFFLVDEEECQTGGTQILVAIMSDLFVNYNLIMIMRVSSVECDRRLYLLDNL